MQLFLFKTNEAVNKGDLNHYHCRLKIVQTYACYASMQKLEKKMERSLSDVLYYRNQVADN